MSATQMVDRKKYASLANSIVVKAIETEKEYEQIVAAVERLMKKGEGKLSTEESELLEVLAILVQAYDNCQSPLPPVAPNEILAYLNGVEQTNQDLLPVLGTRGRVSEVLSGRRSISKE